MSDAPNEVPPATENSIPSPAGNQPGPSDGPDIHEPDVQACIARYWATNVKIMIGLLIIWAGAGLGCGILFADKLNEIQFAGFRLGFWFAQQGSIVIFVLVILAYCILLNRLDKKHHDELHALRNGNKA